MESDLAAEPGIPSGRAKIVNAACRRGIVAKSVSSSPVATQTEGFGRLAWLASPVPGLHCLESLPESPVLEFIERADT